MADALLAMWIAKAPASTYVLAANSSARGDLSVFWENEHGIVITPGAFSNVDGAISKQHDRTWDFDVYVAARYDDEPGTILKVLQVTQALIDTTDEWPKLNGTSGVFNAKVIAGDRPELSTLAADQDGPTYVTRRLTVRVQEIAEITESE